jgi:acetyl esterase/lipase
MARLVLIILLFLISLLAIFKAPAYYLWLLAVAVTEFPWVFAGITLLLLAAGFWVSKYQLPGTAIGIITLLLFLSPIARAYAVGGSLKKGISGRFGTENGNYSAFSFFRMFAPAVKVSYRTFNYITYPGDSLTLDYYPSKTRGNRPCVIVIHGGSWSSGNSTQLPRLNSYLANRGYNVAAINYRLAPKYQNPAPVHDVQAAITYLTRHANDLHIDTSRLILLGRSAGAQIALLAAYTLHNKAIKGVIDFYGPADMVWGYSVPANPLVMDSRLVMRNYLGGSYQEVPQNYATSSPIEFVNGQSPPTLIIHGENDVLVAYEHSRRLNQKLQQYGIKHYWLQLPWATHGFDYNLNGPGGQLSTCAVMQFLQATLR